MHLLMAYGAKAKRVSYSTSHGETLAMVGGIETGTLCMIRMAEIYHEEKRPTIKQMVEIQENGHPERWTAMEIAETYMNFALEVGHFHKTRHRGYMSCQSKNPG